MDYFIFVVILIILVIIIMSSLNGEKQKSNKKYSSSSHEWNSGQDFYDNLKYELYVTPEVFTSLKALKLRDRIFSNQNEVHKLNFNPREAHSIAIFPNHESHSSDNTWSDAGNMLSNKNLEVYYNFLEKVRTIFEDNALSADDRFQKIISLCKQNDKYKEFYKSLNNHYKAFPACLFYKELTKVDSIGDSTAYTLFNSGIKTLKELKDASDEELNEIPGIGKKTIQQIRNYFKNQIELDDDISTKTDIVTHETELSKTPIKSEGVENWIERDDQKSIASGVQSMGVRRSVIQILETTAIMSSSKNINTILGRADFLRERFAEIFRAVKTPQYSSDLQYALDEYRSTYYNTDIKGWQMGIFTKPEEFDLDKFCAECLFEGFMRHHAHQQEQISNLKRNSAIKNRYKKLHETFINFLEEFNKNWNSKAANDFKNEKLEKLKNIESSLISNKK